MMRMLMNAAPALHERDRYKSSPVTAKPFGLSLSKASSSLGKKGQRFDKLTANGVLQRHAGTRELQGQKCFRCC